MSQVFNQNLKRKWLLVFILAPGLLLIYFWLSNSYRAPDTENVEPPVSHMELGEKLILESAVYRVYRGQQLFLDRIDLGNNLAVAEPGMVFLGLGMAVETGGPGYEVKIIDTLGGEYSPLGVKRDLVARSFGFSDNGDFLYLFKVNARAENYFFVLVNEGRPAWRIQNTFYGSK